MTSPAGATHGVSTERAAARSFMEFCDMVKSEQTPQPFLVEFAGCRAGRMTMHLCAGASRLTILASDIYDPFPGLLDWLEDITLGTLHTTWTITQNGELLYVEYAQEETGHGELKVFGREDEESTFSAWVAAREVIEQFYRQFRLFVLSPAYNPDEWESQRLADYLGKHLHMGEEDLRHRLARYPSRAILELEWFVTRRRTLLYPDGTVEWICMGDEKDDPIAAVANERGIAIPEYTPLPDGYDTADYLDRADMLIPYLDRYVRRKSVIRLRELRSVMVEQWLEEHAEVQAESANA